ncbi:hypothetical protein ACA910_015723 [Epithemia clementina (nom. ined.)]
MQLLSSTKVNGCSFSAMQDLQQPQLQQEQQQQLSGANDLFHDELMSPMQNLQQPLLQPQLQQQLNCANDLDLMTPEPQPTQMQEEISQVDQSSFQNPDVAASFHDIFDDAVVVGGGSGETTAQACSAVVADGASICCPLMDASLMTFLDETFGTGSNTPLPQGLSVDDFDLSSFSMEPEPIQTTPAGCW